MTRSTFTLSEELAEQARRLGVNVSRSAREGVEAAVRAALLANDRAAYLEHPEAPDDFWDAAETWSEG